MVAFTGRCKGDKMLTVGLVILVWVSTALTSAPSHRWLICSFLYNLKFGFITALTWERELRELSFSFPVPRVTPVAEIARWDVILRRARSWELGSIKELETQTQKRLFQGNLERKKKKQFTLFLALSHFLSSVRERDRSPWCSVLLFSTEKRGRGDASGRKILVWIERAIGWSDLCCAF